MQRVEMTPQKEFSKKTKFLVVFITLFLITIAAGTWRVLGEVTIGLTLTSNPTLEDGLLGHWTFDGKDVDIATNVVTDRSGSGNNGTTFGMDTATTTAVGRIGQAFEFDGVDDYVNIPSFDPPHQGTFAFWAYVPDDPAAIQRVIGAAGSFEIRIRADNKVSNELFLTDSLPSIATVAVGSWNHLVFTWDFGANIQEIYMDGALDNSGSGTAVDPGGPFDLAIGQRTGQGDFFPGKLDDVRVYDRVLSADEVKHLYGLGATTEVAKTLTENPTLEDGLLGHWTFDGKDVDIAANVVTDLSGQGNNGTTFGMDAATTTAVGKLGQAFEFDGVDDYVNDEDAELYLNGLSAVTMAAWVKAKSTGTNEGVLGWRTISGGDSGNIRYDSAGFSGGGTNVIKAALSVTSGSAGYESASNAQTTDWQHLVLTWESGELVKLYIDSILDIPTFEGTIQTGTTTLAEFFRIGVGRKNTDPYWNGLIDDVRVYNRALSRGEVEQLYQLGATTKIAKTLTTNPTLEDGLVGHWTFDGPDVNIATNVVTDRSGQGNNGTTFGMDTATTTAVGKLGQAFELDGSNDYVIADGVTGSLGPLPFTVSAWVYPNDVSRGVPFSFHSSGTNRNLFFWAQDGSTQKFLHFDSTNSFVTGTDTFNPREWHHIVWRIDSGGAGAMFVNGIEQATWSNSDTGSVNQFSLGQEWDTGTASDFFNGRIDDARVYNRALSRGEIERLYELGR